MELSIKTPGTKVKIEGKNLLIENSEEKKRVSIRKLKKLILKENISISTNSIALLLKNNVDIYFTDWKEDILGELRNLENRVKGDRLIKQCEFSRCYKGLKLSKGWIVEKSKISINHLKEMKAPKSIISKMNKSLDKLKKEDRKNYIRGYEGDISKIYISYLQKNSEIKINKRSLHPSSDIFNISLNYTYGILYRYLHQKFLKNNIDPSIGFFHSNIKSYQPLVYDFSEKYKILFFKNIYELTSLEVLSDKDLEKEKDKILISSEGKSKIVDEFYKMLERRVPKKILTLEKLIEKEIKELGGLIDDFNSL